MSRYMRFAVCAVLVFGVLAMTISSNSPSTETTQPELDQLLAEVDAKLAVKEPVVEEQAVATPSPRMSEQARRARDRRAEDRENRSIQMLDKERPDTDVINVRKIP